MHLASSDVKFFKCRNNVGTLIVEKVSKPKNRDSFTAATASLAK
jgi:hypothetical protein